MPARRPVQEGTWGVVVPVKALPIAKSRLSPYGDQVRRELALAFAADVVAAVLQTTGVGRVLVVTDDAEAEEVTALLGAETTEDTPRAGLSAAFAHGTAVLRQSSRTPLPVAALAADLPALQPGHLAAVLALVPSGSRGFVPDAADTGTTLLAAGAGVDLAPQFGPSSAALHLQSGARPLPAAAGLRLDVDRPQDLQAALRLGVGPHTLAVVARRDLLAG